MSARLPALLLAVVLTAGACTDQPTGIDPAPPNAAIDVDDPRGELVVTVAYDGTPYTTASPVADNDCEMLVDVNVPTWSGNAVRMCETTRTTIISPGTFSWRAWIYDGFRYPTLASAADLVVTAGTTTVRTFDFADWTGVVSGVLQVDGAVPPAGFTVCLETGGCSSLPSGTGAFRILTGAGSGTASVRNEQRQEIHSFTYTATLGAEVDVGTVAASDPRADLTVNLLYGSAPYDPSAPAADNLCEFLMDVNVPSWSGNAVRLCEGSRSTTVMPGRYGVRPWIYDGFRYPTLVSGMSFEAAAGEDLDLTWDFADWTGLVTGVVTVDGAAPAPGFTVCLSTGGCSSFPRGGGAFRIATGAGKGTGSIRNGLRQEVGSFTYTANVGATSDVGLQNATDPRAELTVRVLYGGSPWSSAAPVADNDCELLLDVNVVNWSGNAVRFCEGARTATVMPGTYGMRPWLYDGFRYPTLASGLTLEMEAGVDRAVDVDFAAWTGIVTGTVFVDGAPATSQYRVCLTTGGCSRFPRGDGTFRLITGAGSGEGVIWNNIGVELGRFAYGATPGDETDVGTIGDNDAPVADAGSDRTVESTAADDGTTTVVLDGSASSDADGQVVSWSWRSSGTEVATGAQATLELADGTHSFELVVTDDDGEESAPATVTITIADRTAPTVHLAMLTDELWPPNGRMIVVARGVRADDAGDASPVLEVRVLVDGAAAESSDWSVTPNGDGTLDVALRAHRAGSGGDRVYQVVVTARDASGNAATAEGRVTVPHDQRGKKK